VAWKARGLHIQARREFAGLGAFAAFTEGLAVEADKVFYTGLGPVAENIKKHAVAVVGDESKLKPLAPSTIADKEAKGYQFPDAPLIATGEMRASISAFYFPGVPQAMVGSPDVKLLWHHLGARTGRNHASTLPSRPVLDFAVRESEAENIIMMEQAAGQALGILI